jgi:DNA polymerase-4
MPRFDLRKAEIRCLQGDLSADPGDLRRIHADHRAIVTRRGVSRCHRKPQGHRLSDSDRGRNPGKIRAETELTASAGVSYNKFLAKLASDHRKPDGLFVITPKMGPEFVETLPVRKFHGVGPATAAKMQRLGIKTGLDLRAQTLVFLQQHFGKAGSYYYWVARGVDERPVRANRLRKSVGAENTFTADLFTYEAARDALREIVDKVWRYCEGSGTRGRTVTLKVKFANFRQITRSRTGQMQVRTRSELEQLGNALLEPLFPVAKGIRLLGVSLSSLAVEEAEREPEFGLPP